MSRSPAVFARREMVMMAAAYAGAVRAAAVEAGTQLVLSLREVIVTTGEDPRLAIQNCLDQLAAAGGGTLRIGGDFSGGEVRITGRGIIIEGDGGTLFDTRITVDREARDLVIRNLAVLDRSGRDGTFLLDVAGSRCRFENLALIKRPAAGGYQGYLRTPSSHCTFIGLTMAGSNGLFVAGHDHLIDRFEIVSTLRSDFGGDDAFAIKGTGAITRNITIRNGTVRGYAAAFSIGSEVGSTPEFATPGGVIGVSVSNVRADRCARVCFIKPGALIYDWRNGIVRDVTMDSITLNDPEGAAFVAGIVISAARGAEVRNVRARNIRINARTNRWRVVQTAAVDITLRPDGAPATVHDIDLQVDYDGRGLEGQPVDYVARIEKASANHGTISRIVLNVSGQDTRIGGIYVGGGMDDQVTVRRARLAGLGRSPPATLGAAGIWADSRVVLGSVDVTTMAGPRFGGSAF